MEAVEEPLCEELYIEEDKQELTFTSVDVAEVEAVSNGPAQVTKSDTKSSQEAKVSTTFDDQFSFFFYKISGADERLDAFELQRVMSMIFRSKFPKNQEFSLEACRAMVSSMDQHRLGKLNFTQFKELWHDLMKWKHVFDVSDKNEDTKIDHTELSVGLKKMGLQLDEDTVRVLMNRFQNNSKLIELDDFMQICCKTKSASKCYEEVIKDGTAELDTFMLHIIYN